MNKSKLLFISILISTTISQAEIINGFHKYIWDTYLNPDSVETIETYAPSTFSEIEHVYHKPDVGHIVISLNSSSWEAPEWGSFVYLYDPGSEVSRERANLFLTDLLYAKANGLTVKFIKPSTASFYITGIVIGDKIES